MVEVKVDKDRREKFPLYFDGESVSGKVRMIAITLVNQTSFLCPLSLSELSDQEPFFFFFFVFPFYGHL